MPPESCDAGPSSILKFTSSRSGAPATGESFIRAGQIAAEHWRPISDQRGPADYKRHLAAELTVRALSLARDRALARAHGGEE